jgi:hypothetical protein
MAGPVASFVQLPVDTGNAGKMVKTTSEVVGANTVHRHHYVAERSASILGTYAAATALNSVSATATNGTATGLLWFTVPTAVTGKAARIRRLIARHTVSAVTPVMVTAPRIALARITFTGTASGASITPAKYASSAPAPVADLRTAVTGLTVTLGATLCHTVPPAFILAGTAATVQQASITIDPMISIGSDEDEWPVLLPGEGLVIYQPDAGTTADTRRFTLDLVWDEIDVA